MLHRIVRTACTVALGYSLALLPALCAADDEKDVKPAKEPAAKATDWSAYASVGVVVGEIVKADDRKLTLRVTWDVPPGGNNHRPPLHQANQNYRNPYAPNQNRPNQPKVKHKEQHHDYELEFVPETLVRTKKLPPKTDDKGKRVDYTQSEIEALRAPDRAPVYAASAADLIPGTIVEVRMIRDKTITAAKMKEDDIRVKYAIILGKDPNPPKDITNPKDDKKGKKKN